MANVTTAHYLGAYRRELLKEGIEPTVIQTLIVEASRALLREEPLTLAEPDARDFVLIDPEDDDHVAMLLTEMQASRGVAPTMVGEMRSALRGFDKWMKRTGGIKSRAGL